MYKPVVAVTSGDAAGIGPEITLKAILSEEVQALSRMIAVGDPRILRKAAEASGVEASIRPVGRVSSADFRPGVVNVIKVDGPDLEGLQPGAPQAASGEASYRYIEAAVGLALSNQVDAIATAPISKEALRMAGHEFPGHTELLAHLTGAERYLMMLVAGSCRVALATIHHALSEVPRILTTERVENAVTLADSAGRMFGVERPRIGVAGLNPHAGEGGLFGDEEARIIAPAVQALQRLHIDVTGPYPPDTVFYRAFRKGEFDIVVAMYHDQGCIPFKLVGFETGVNVTIGLPIVRTSVDHGTAYDLAASKPGSADPRSMIEAVKMASTMALSRRAWAARGGSWR
ncbi:MAG: 4-hydroxythreonine-4-phosphate dehydrogenase PdxA [Candidatus Bathyarchaeia archaeon]